MSDTNYASQRLAARLAVDQLAHPKIPAVDHYDLDDGDATHPIYIKYLAPSTAVTIGKVTLSWTNLPFRSTTTLNPSTIGTDATGSSGHSHSHAHNFVLDNNSVGSAVIFGTVSNRIGIGGGGTDATGIQTNAVGESGHSHSHSHSLSGASSQAVTDAVAGSNVTALSLDGIDYTAKLGGPWAGDVVEMDITSVFQAATGQWHTILLSLAGLGRVVSMLRVYYV